MTISEALRHYFNPLHVFCRLRRLGLSKKTSLRLVRFYERYLFFSRSGRCTVTPQSRPCAPGRAEPPCSTRCQ